MEADIPYEQMFTVFYEGTGPTDGIMIPSMLGWTDEGRAKEFHEYVTEMDASRARNGEEIIGRPILIHRTGENTWEKVTP